MGRFHVNGGGTVLINTTPEPKIIEVEKIVEVPVIQERLIHVEVPVEVVRYVDNRDELNTLHKHIHELEHALKHQPPHVITNTIEYDDSKLKRELHDALGSLASLEAREAGQESYNAFLAKRIDQKTDKRDLRLYGAIIVALNLLALLLMR